MCASSIRCDGTADTVSHGWASCKLLTDVETYPPDGFVQRSIREQRIDQSADAAIEIGAAGAEIGCDLGATSGDGVFECLRLRFGVDEVVRLGDAVHHRHAPFHGLRG